MENKTMIKAKLNFTSEYDYKQNAKLVQENLESLNPIPLKLDLGNYFADIKDVMPIYAKPYSRLEINPRDYSSYGYSIKFGLKFDEKTLEKVLGLLRTCKLNPATLEELHRNYKSLYEKEAMSLEQAISVFRSPCELFEELSGVCYSLRHIPRENVITATCIHSGDFKNQGLMSRFYDYIAKTSDLDSIKGLRIEEVLEENTRRIFDELRSETSDDTALCEALKSHYIKSPFMRLFARLGFKDMTLLKFYDSLDEIYAKKSDELGFRIGSKKKEPQY